MRYLLFILVFSIVACGGEEENMEGPPPMVSIENNGLNPCFIELVAIITTDSPDNPIVSINWTGPDNFTSSEEGIEAKVAGTYIVEATNQNGQSESASIEISADEIMTIPPSVVITDLGLDSEFNFILMAVAGRGSATVTDFTWSNGASTAEIKVDSAGTYSVTITDECGATASAMVEVTELDLSPYEGKWKASDLDVKVTTTVGNTSNTAALTDVALDYTVILASPNWTTEGSYTYEVKQGNSSTISEVTNIMGNGTYSIEDDILTIDNSFFNYDNMMSSASGMQTANVSINAEGQMVITQMRTEESISNGLMVVIEIASTSVWDRE